MLAASVLTDEPVKLTNVPMIRDVVTMLDILEDLGVSVSVKGHTVEVCAKGLRKTKLSRTLCSRARSSILFAGPLTARLGRCTLFAPGGDVIGRRRVDTHIEGLRKLGVRLEMRKAFVFKRTNFKGTRILLDEASVTATENILMCAVLAPGKTTIFNAASEPHVQDLCRMLNKMGARISGIGTNYLKIRGVERLGGAKHRVSPDYIDVASRPAMAHSSFPLRRS
jgi:UDP-N-acetylglucosamine 1-carboxyvinyltransferase